MGFEPCFPFDAEKVDLILRQVATMQIVSLHTKIVWKETDNGVLQSLYGLKASVIPKDVGVAAPGFVESSFTPGVHMRPLIEKQAQTLWKNFLEHFAKGPESAKQYIEQQTNGLKRNVRELERVRLQARQVNEQADQLLQKTLFWLHTTKFSCEIAMNILGIIPGGGMVGFIVRTGLGLGYPVGVELITNWEDANICNIGLLAFLGAVKTNIASFLTEDQTMGKAEVKLVKDPVQQARAKLAFQQGLRKARRTSTSAVKGAKTNLVIAKGNAAMTSLSLKTLGAGLTGISCYFAVTGSIQSGEAYQEALEAL